MPITNANVEKDSNNKLLKRREMLVSIEYEGSTPSREEIKRSLADRFNLKQENIVVMSASQLYGTKKCTVLVHEYSDKEAMGLAQKHIIARPNKKKAVAEAAPAPKPAAAEQKGEAKKPDEAKQ